ncbi:hypothetical protein KC318_g12975, partial [Hortaea werneckii]
DVSSVHSSALGGGAALPTQYPPMFQNFQDAWPQLPPGAQRNGLPMGTSPRPGGPQSIAGDSVAASELTDATTSGGGAAIHGAGQQQPGQGGVSLAGLSIQDLNKQASLSQSDKLRRYVEGQPTPAQQLPPIGAGRHQAGHQPATANRSMLGGNDDDAKSVSTAFASQVD